MKETRLIILFGSQARDTAGRQSDIDVAVLTDHPLSLEEKSDAAAEVAKRLNVGEDKIDVIDLRNVSPLLGRQIADEGKLLHGSEFEFLRFRVLAWKRYQDTAKFRRARERALAKYAE